MPRNADVPPGQVRRTITEEQVIPVGQSQDAKKNPFYDRPFWDVIADITRTRGWGNHMVRVYRATDQWKAGTIPEGNKLIESFDEDTIRAKWGGGKYLLWLYSVPPGGASPTTLQMRECLELEGASRAAGSAPYYQDPRMGSGSGDALAMEILNELRAQRGGAMVQDALKQSMEIMATAYRSAVSVVQTGPAAGAAPVVDEFEREFRRAMLQRMLAPPPDPMEGFKNIAAMIAAMSGTMKEVTGSLQVAASKPDVFGAVLNQIPTLLEKGVAGLHEYRLATEAQAKIAGVQGATRVIDVEPQGAHVSTAPPQAATPQPAATVQTPAPAAKAQTQEPQPQDEAPQPPNTTYVLQRIAATIRNSTAETKGEDLYNFLDVDAPGIIEQIKGLSRQVIIDELFRKNPILIEVANHSNLPRIIDEFLAIANAGPVQ